MQIPLFIRQIPHYPHLAWNHVKGQAGRVDAWLTPKIQQCWQTSHRHWHSLTTTIAQYWQVGSANCQQSDLWIHYGKPFYERNIQPLNHTDYLLLGGSGVTACLVGIIAFQCLGIAALPIVIGVDTTLVLGAGTFSRYRVKKHFDTIAWDHIDHIRRLAYQITYRNQKFAEINQYRGYLEQPEFEHLKDDLKQLDEELRYFRKIALTPYYEDMKKTVKAHLHYFKTRPSTPSLDTTILQNLEQVIDTVGKKEQNLGLLETRKIKLNELQSIEKNQITEMTKEIDLLVQSAQAPHLKDTKKALLEHLQAFQQKLNYHKTIENLEENLETESADEEEIDNSIDNLEEEEDILNPLDSPTLALPRANPTDNLEEEEEIDDSVLSKSEIDQFEIKIEEQKIKIEEQN